MKSSGYIFNNEAGASVQMAIREQSGDQSFMFFKYLFQIIEVKYPATAPLRAPKISILTSNIGFLCSKSNRKTVE